MRVCTWHHETMLSAIKHRGLARHIKTDEKMAAICAQLWVEGRTTTETFDPRNIVVLEAVKFAREIAITHMISLAPMHDCPFCRMIQLLGAGQDLKWLGACLDQLIALCNRNDIRVG